MNPLGTPFSETPFSSERLRGALSVNFRRFLGGSFTSGASVRLITVARETGTGPESDVSKSINLVMVSCSRIDTFKGQSHLLHSHLQTCPLDP